MPEDAIVPFEYDETGDVGTVSGEDFYYHHAKQLGLIATEEVKGEGLTETDVVSIRDTIGSTIAGSPFFESPITVTIVQAGGEQITAEVDINNVGEFELEL